MTLASLIGRHKNEAISLKASYSLTPGETVSKSTPDGWSMPHVDWVGSCCTVLDSVLACWVRLAGLNVEFVGTGGKSTET